MAQTHKHSLLPCTSDDVPVAELRQSLPSQIQAISPFVEQLMHFIAKSRSMDGSEMDIEIALREALENAIVHGNRGDPDKRVYLTFRCTPTEKSRSRFRTTDRGLTLALCLIRPNRKIVCELPGVGSI
jgi:anti-sigma regulatory factor (Ser/Thr protein kinase)